jgi:hypothetical protein
MVNATDTHGRILGFLDRIICLYIPEDRTLKNHRCKTRVLHISTCKVKIGLGDTVYRFTVTG